MTISVMTHGATISVMAQSHLSPHGGDVRLGADVPGEPGDRGERSMSEAALRDISDGSCPWMYGSGPMSLANLELVSGSAETRRHRSTSQRV
jgi:hypothetical protein